MTRAVLILIGLATCGFGIAFVLRPVEMGGVLDLPLRAAAARVDVRAIYGGMQVGIGLFLLGCAVRRSLVRTGLAAAACVFSCMALARLFGLAVEGLSQPLLVIVLMLEAMVAVLATWGALTTPAASRLTPPMPVPGPPAIAPAESDLDLAQPPPMPHVDRPRPEDETPPPPGPSSP